MLEVSGLTVRFGGVTPIDDMTVYFAEGACGLIGPNGAGKTTFFNVLSGFVSPVAGSVTAFGDNLLKMADFRRAHEAMWALPLVESPLRPEIIDDAVDLYRRARRAGVPVRSGVDCLIAACAVRHNLEVLHVDRDFTSLSRISQLDSTDLRQKTRRLSP